LDKADYPNKTFERGTRSTRRYFLKKGGIMDKKLIIVNVIIHGFAAAHAATAALLSQTLVGDEAALTALTITMIIGISRVYERPFGVGEALSVLGIFAGFYENMPEYPLLCKGMNGILFREFEGQIPSI
jgi:hypothetical protein